MNWFRRRRTPDFETLARGDVQRTVSAQGVSDVNAALRIAAAAPLLLDALEAIVKYGQHPDLAEHNAWSCAAPSCVLACNAIVLARGDAA